MKHKKYMTMYLALIMVLSGGCKRENKDINITDITTKMKTATQTVSITPSPTPVITPKPVVTVYDAVNRLKIGDKASNIFVVIQKKDSIACDFYAYEKKNDTWKEAFKTEGYLGRNGIISADEKIEGDGHTPAGIYTFSKCFGINDNPGNVPMGYTKVTEDDYWDSNSASKTYNTFIKRKDIPGIPDKNKYEHIIEYTVVYNYIAAINYNIPAVPRKGSAIFLHCTRPNGTRTAGCVAIPESFMINALSMIYEDTYIVIVRSFDDLNEYFS